MPNESPPAIVKKACSLGEHASQYRLMNRTYAREEIGFYYRRGEKLNVVKEQCIAEGAHWLKWLKDAEENERNAQKYIRLFLNWDKLSGVCDSVRMGLNEALEHLSNVEAGQCRQCFLNPPGKKNCKDCKAKRQKRTAGEDALEPYEKQIVAADTVWKKRLEPLAKTKAVPAAIVERAFKALEALLDCFRKLSEADLKPAEPPRKDKCKHCHAAILWAGPGEVSGKNVPLDPEPGDGQFELVQNRPVYRPWSNDLDTSKLYRRHDCPQGKEVLRQKKGLRK